MSQANISAIVCAAGTSTRMGATNKLLIPMTQASMIKQVVAELIMAQVSEIIVVTGHEAKEITMALGEFSSQIKIVFHPEYNLGQTSSIQAGLRAVAEHKDAVMICLSDMPLLLSIHYNTLIQYFDEQRELQSSVIVRPLCNGKPGHPVILSTTFIPEILKCKEMNGPKSVIQDNLDSFRPLTTDDTAFFTDIDSPEDLKLFQNKNLQ